MNKIITISREFGSGGKEIGKRLADELGYAFYDNQIITMLSKETGLSEDYVKNISEKGIYPYPFHFGQTFRTLNSIQIEHNKVLVEQQKIIKKIASKGNCIIVGRGADVILQEFNPFKIFVYADMEAKIKRCIEKAPKDESLSLKEFEKKIDQVDRNRKNYHSIISDLTWGVKENYDLCLNTTNINIKKIIKPLSNYIEEYFKEEIK